MLGLAHVLTWLEVRLTDFRHFYLPLPSHPPLIVSYLSAMDCDGLEEFLDQLNLQNDDTDFFSDNLSTQSTPSTPDEPRVLIKPSSSRLNKNLTFLSQPPTLESFRSICVLRTK